MTNYTLKKDPSTVTFKVQENLREQHLPIPRKNTYSYIMWQLGKKVNEASYVKNDPEFQKRKSRFFGTKKENDHDRKVLSIMR